MLRHSLLLMFSLLVTSVATAQDIEKKIETLVEQRAKAIAQLDDQFRVEISKVRDAHVKELEEQLATAMKALDLEKSNKLNETIKQWKQLSPIIHRRTVFVRIPESKDGKLWFFARGPEGIWLECTPDNIYRNKETAVTPDYIELTHESGNVHRLYDTKNMYRVNDSKEFKMGSKGYWLGDLEITVPGKDK